MYLCARYPWGPEGMPGSLGTVFVCIYEPFDGSTGCKLLPSVRKYSYQLKLFLKETNLIHASKTTYFMNETIFQQKFFKAQYCFE